MPRNVQLTAADIEKLPPAEREAALRELGAYMAIGQQEPWKLITPYGWQKDFIASPARIRVAHCGNQVGKTTIGVWDTIALLKGEHPARQRPNRPMRMRVCAPDLEHGVQQWVETFMGLISHKQVKKRFDPNSQTHKRITFHRSFSGYSDDFIEFLTYRQDTQQYEGVKCDRVIYDEIPPRAKWDVNYMRTISRGGDLMVTATPDNAAEPYFAEMIEEYCRQSDPKTGAVLCELFAGDVFQAAQAGIAEYTIEQMKMVESTMTEEEAAARLHGQFINIAGVVFKEFIDRFADDPMRPGHLFKPHLLWKESKKFPGMYLPPEDWPVVVAVDPSDNGYTGALWCAIGPDDTHYYYDEYYERNLVIQEHARRMLDKVDMQGVEPDEWVFDPAAEQPVIVSSAYSTYMEQYDEHSGGRILPVTSKHLKDESGRNQIARNRLFRGPDGTRTPTIFVAEGLTNFRRQLRRVSYQMVRDHDGRNPKQKTQDRDNHLTDCFGYVEGMEYEHADFRTKTSVKDWVYERNDPTVSYGHWRERRGR